MAIKPAQKSRVRALVDELIMVVGGEWATIIDQPFDITGYTEHMVIFDLCFRIEVKDEDLVVVKDEIIGRCL